MKSIGVVGICILLHLGACSSQAPYPENWRPLPKNPPDQCAIEAGLYLNEMESDSNVRLSSVFGFSHKIDYVQLAVDEHNRLSAAAVLEGDIIESKVFEDADEKPVCKNGWLLFKNAGWESGQAGYGYQSQVTGLLMHDNYLFVKESGSFVGWVYIMPLAGRGSNWHRYRYIGDLDLPELRREIQQLREKGYKLDKT